MSRTIGATPRLGNLTNASVASAISVRSHFDFVCSVVNIVFGRALLHRDILGHPEVSAERAQVDLPSFHQIRRELRFGSPLER